jgi:predicted RNA-binding protein with PUA-like domain
MSRRYWLMKCEPDAYSIDDFARDGKTHWEGVRNYQVRNFMRDDMKLGDGVLFYASSAEPSGVTGLARVCREAYPDPYAFKKGHEYFDPKSRKENPTWLMVDLEFIEKLGRVFTLEDIKRTPGLENMLVARRGNRLSVTPVTRQEWDILRKAAGARQDA